MRRSIDYLETHYAEPVAIGKVSAIAGLSELHFMRSFRAATRIPVHSYLTRIRLGRAKGQLSRGVGAAETALRVVFFDQ
ncbi:helix-turn-helix domain-containing protein [Brucella pituitosa]|uniref:helix-turn-helix domain-containing protein n=1 Tax=Brucella pituitosa TaxID=571256 RepID=UPI000F5F096F|nr:AraC family transcriptional regulator [Brucellaceae bacterium VT-16-1752]